MRETKQEMSKALVLEAFDTLFNKRVSGRPGEAPAYAGTDFIIVRDGQIAAVYLLFDKLP